MSDTNYIKIGCEVFIVNSGKLLLGKRKNSYGTGDWGLPGGHVEYGEKLVETAIRELKEELDISGVNLELITITDDPRGDQHYLHVSFLLKDFAGEYKLMEPEKCEEWRWFDLNELPENIFIAHKNILTTFQEKKLYLY